MTLTEFINFSDPLLSNYQTEVIDIVHPDVHSWPRSRIGKEQTRSTNHYSRPHPDDATGWEIRPALLGSIRETLEDIENYSIKLNFTLSWDG